MSTNTNISDLVQRYRMALQFIWNSCIYSDPTMRDWDSVSAFQKLRAPLYQAIIANGLSIDSEELFGKQFQIVAKTNFGGLPKIEVNVNLRGPADRGGGIFNPIQGPFTADRIRLSLIDLFEWSPMQYIDLPYYRVLIEEFSDHPQWVGHDALVEIASCDVFWVPDPNIDGCSVVGRSESL